MGDGKHCPNCGKDIGIWPPFFAGLPNRFWCPHCKARLRYPNSDSVGASIGRTLLISLGSIYASRVLMPSEPWLAQVGLSTLLFVAVRCVVEFLVLLVLRSHYELASVASKPK